MTGRKIYVNKHKAIYHESVDGKIHACDGGEVHKGIVLIWTLCDKDVPANGAFTIKHSEYQRHDAERVTCEVCKKVLQNNYRKSG